MTKRIAAIALIFVLTSIAWAILGATILVRTYKAGPVLGGKVASTWGAPHEQGPPSATFSEKVAKVVETVEDGRKVSRTQEECVVTPLPLERSRVKVAIDLESRRKGLLWYSTYAVSFEGEYTFRNPDANERRVELRLLLPTPQAIYDGLSLSLDGAPLEPELGKAAATASANVAAGASATLKVAYRSQGLGSWKYRLGSEVARVRDFRLEMATNFRDVDFPDNSLSPTSRRETAEGAETVWSYANLVSGYEIGMTMPEKLQPGPLAGRISFFAPVSLLFFFFLMFVLTTLRRIELHPMNYFFLAAAFFSFHLLLAYLVDHVSVHAAFATASAVSVFLVVSYLRLVTGMRFAAVEAGLTQILYLVLFSYAFFFRGYTGLTLTIGSILTLFVVMQATGRIRWSERFGEK
jgi:inner membrane protein involved in colicin E2 resistance